MKEKSKDAESHELKGVERPGMRIDDKTDRELDITPDGQIKTEPHDDVWS